MRSVPHTRPPLQMRVKLHELKQGLSLEVCINDLDNLARHLQLSEQQKIHYFIFGLRPKLKQAILIRQPKTYEDAVTFAKWKHQCTDSNSELLQEIQKEVSLKYTGIKQEPYSAPVQETHNAQMQPKISQLQTNKQFPKEAMTTRHNQYAAPLDTNPVALQQQLSKSKSQIKQLQQDRRPDSYLNTPGTRRNFRTTDGQIICHRFSHVGHFARSCETNLTPLKTKTGFPHAQSHAGGYQNQKPGYVNHGTLRYSQPQYVPNHNPRQNAFRTENDKKAQYYGISLPTGLHLYQIPTGNNLPI